jgi:hypothetical protein
MREAALQTEAVYLRRDLDDRMGRACTAKKGEVRAIRA